MNIPVPEPFNVCSFGIENASVQEVSKSFPVEFLRKLTLPDAIVVDVFNPLPVSLSTAKTDLGTKSASKLT